MESLEEIFVIVISPKISDYIIYFKILFAMESKIRFLSSLYPCIADKKLLYKFFVIQ